MEFLDPVMFAKVMGYVVLVNAVLLGLHKSLDAIAKFTENKTDDKIAEVFGKILGGLSKIIEISLGSLGKK